MRTGDQSFRLAAFSILAGALAGTAAAGGAADAGCSAGARPAATLLIPYFEVEVADPAGLSTLVAVGNADDQPALARVVLWTDWGVPTLAFDVYLAADDLQTINLRDVFAGTLPTTGGPGFPGCTDPVTNPALGPEEVAALRRQHTGQPDGEGLCFGRGRLGPGVANGYLTVDALNRCAATPRYPSDDGYFEAGGSGVASNDNVLYGDFFYVPISISPLQSWVLPLYRASGRFSVGLGAVRTRDELCDQPPFPHGAAVGAGEGGSAQSSRS